MTIDEKKYVIDIAKELMITAMEKNSYLISTDSKNHDVTDRAKNIADNFNIIVEGVKQAYENN